MATTRVTGRGQKSPVDEEFLKQLYQGGELLAQGRVPEARQLLERAHQLQPRNEKGRNLLGLAYFKLGLFDRAAEIYEALVRDNPVDATLRVNLGLVYLKTNALQRAMREFEAATDLQPDHQKAHNYLGLALAQAGEYGRAREHFVKAGSEVMAEKMAKAIAGEKFARPSRSMPVLPREPTPAPRPMAPVEGQWGTQFGLDETPPAPRPAQEEEPEELRFAEDEGPGALSGSPADAAGAEEERTPADNVEAEMGAALAETSQAETPGEPLPQSLDEAVPELPSRVAAFRPGADVPLLAELVPALALAGASQAQPFRVGNGSFAARVEGELLTRLEGLVAYTGQIHFQPEVKRFRGRPTDEPFGDGAGRFVRASGQGVLFLEPAASRSFLAVDLGDVGAYVREECVFAFEEAVAFDNGKVPSEVAPDLELVHLRGQGRVVLSLGGTLRSVPVAEETPVTVPLSHLVGWQGKVTPRVVPLPGEEAAPRVAVELSGEGFALIVLPVR
ncbi:tetratricopeptide repeat protein [Archangium gephyra]|uniref:Tetratricopeptide repeat protein n=1 Tax=Archangium gephyra TaxID=48 RepID=A0AAC8TE76_9BACT|nr:tetratricopeptide repeat protein [Archangium gephyra]AKJ02715.1 TolA protein [Archangium gephyra]REG23260.1 tetratricopeptide repeat protein [Archangium gephyra]